MFDTAADIAVARTTEDLETTLRPVLASLGFDNFILTETRAGVTRVAAGAPPALWWPHMTARGYARDDVVFRQARASPDAFFYSDVTEAPDLSAEQRRIIGERKEFGVGNGFVNPVHLRDGTLSAVVFAGQHIDHADPYVRAAAHVLADYYGIVARRLAADAAAPAPAITLTTRQRDCLAWVREGKSATDIGAILGISVHTVQEHVAQACQRLGVRTRVQAVAAAMSLRLIDP